jgi:hypothetical protein
MKALGASARRKISPLRGSLKIITVLAAVVGFGLAAERTDAAHAGHAMAAKPAKEQVASVAAKDVETTSSTEMKSMNDAPCDISRKRLFVEGEGWIVRRVTTCY